LLEDWGRRTVRDLQSAFEAELALLTAGGTSPEDATSGSEESASVGELIAELERWPTARSEGQH
jgi:hypothetical protein